VPGRRPREAAIDSPPAGSHRERGTYALAAFLLVLMALQAVAQHSYGALAPFISDAFDASSSQMGVMGAALYCGTATAAVALGGWVDRRSPATVVAVTLLGVAAAMLVVAVAPVVAVAVVGYLLVGLFRGAIPPLCDRVAFEHAPSHLRGLVFGIKQTGSPLGSITAAMLLPPIAVGVLGWRGASVGVAIVLVVAALAAGQGFRAFEARERSRTDTADLGGEVGGPDAGTEPVRTPIRTPARDRSAATHPPASHTSGVGLTRRLVPALVFNAGLGAQLAVGMTFLTLFLVDVVEMDPVAAGRSFALFNLGGVAGRVAWGWLSDRRFLDRRSVLLLVSALTTGTIAILLGTAPGVVLAPPFGLGIGVFGFFAQSWVGVTRVWGVELAGKGSAGRAGGRMLAAMMGGGLTGPLLFGWLADLTGSYRVGWVGLGTLACMTGVSVVPAVRRELTGARSGP
jgi:sugar phosphate permease